NAGSAVTRPAAPDDRSPGDAPGCAAGAPARCAPPAAGASAPAPFDSAELLPELQPVAHASSSTPATPNPTIFRIAPSPGGLWNNPTSSTSREPLTCSVVTEVGPDRNVFSGLLGAPAAQTPASRCAFHHSRSRTLRSGHGSAPGRMGFMHVV